MHDLWLGLPLIGLATILHCGIGISVRFEALEDFICIYFTGTYSELDIRYSTAYIYE